MKKIRIVDRSDQPETFISVEREVFYKELLSSQKLDTISYVDGFVEIDNYLFDNKDRFTSSNLFFINIKKILAFCIPVITKKVLAKPDTKKKIESAQYVTIQLEYSSFSFVFDGTTLLPYTIPKGTKFEIIGFVFPQDTDFSLVPLYFKEQLPFSLNPFKTTRELFSFITNEEEREVFMRKVFSFVTIKDEHLIEYVDKKTNIRYSLIKEDSYQKNDFYIALLKKIQTYVDMYHRMESMWYVRYIYYYYYRKLKNQMNKISAFRTLSMDIKNSYVSKIKKWNDLPFLKMFNKVSSIYINPYYNSSTYMVIQMIQESELYDHLIVYSESHSSVQSKLKRIDYQKKQNQIVQENIKKYTNATLQKIHVERIARSTFPDMFNASSKKCIFKPNQLFDIKRVPKTMKDTIMLLYEKQKTFLSQYTSNTCEHRKVLRRYHMYPSIETFKEIKKYLNVSSKKDSILTCKLCQFDLICIHEYEYYEQLGKIQEDYSSEKESILKSDIIEKYRDDVPVQFIIFCRICSKELGKSIDIEQYTAFIGEKLANAFISFDDEVNNRLVYYTKDIVTKYIDISQLNISKKKFAYKIVNMVYPFIKEMNERLEKSATLVDKKTILDIHSMIYIFSCIAYISSFIQFVLIHTKIGGKKMTKHAMDLDIIRKTFAVAFSIIIKTNEYKKSNITKDKIKQLLIEYYRTISSKEISFEESIKTNYSLIHSILNSTIYQYIVELHHILNPKDKEPSTNITYFLHKKKETLLHIRDRKKTPIDVYNAILDNIYDNVRVPFSVDSMNIKTIENRKDYMEKSFFQVIYLYIVKGLYTISPYTSMDTNTSLIQDIQKDYDILTTSIMEYEAKLRDEEIIHNLPAMFYLPTLNSRESEYHLEACHQIYCLDGRRHQFKYMTDTSSKHKKETEDIKSNDLQCVLCNNRLSVIKKEDKKKTEENNKIINSNLSDRNNSTIFFHLYFNACPKNTNHVFDEKTHRCRFCSVTKRELIEQEPSYFKKFKDVFHKHFDKKQKKFVEDVRVISAPVIPLKKSKDTLKPIKIESLKQVTLEMIQILSKKFKIEVYQLEYLGCFENISYEPAASLYAKGGLDEYVTPNILSRVTTLLHHNTTFGIYYRILRNIHPFYRHPDEYFSRFFDKIKDKSFSFRKIPSIELDGNQYYQKYKEEKIDDKTLGSILLYILYKNLLDILNKSIRTTYEKEIYEFIDVLLKRFIYYDQVTSQYDIKQLQFKKSEKKEVLKEEIQQIEYEDEDVQEDNLFSYDYLDIDSDLLDEGYDIDVDLDK